MKKQTSVGLAHARPNNECQYWYTCYSLRSFMCCGGQELHKGATCVYIPHGSSTIDPLCN